jgi:small subunit ribosomal protein S6
MVQTYELLYIIPGDKTEEEAKPITEQIKGLLTQLGATIANQDYWGKRKLAYEIEHIRQGYYDLIAFDVDTSKLPEIETALRLHEDVLRHMITIRIVKTPEQILAETQLRERIAAKRAAVKEKEVVAAVA